VDAVAVDCAANDGTNRESANTPARQDAAGWAEKIRGTTSIMFSLYADFFPLPGPGTTSVTTLKWNKRLAPAGQSSHPALCLHSGLNVGSPEPEFPQRLQTSFNSFDFAARSKSHPGSEAAGSWSLPRPGKRQSSPLLTASCSTLGCKRLECPGPRVVFCLQAGFPMQIRAANSPALAPSRRWSGSRARSICPRRHLRVLPTRTRPSLFASD